LFISDDTNNVTLTIFRYYSPKLSNCAPYDFAKFVLSFICFKTVITYTLLFLYTGNFQFQFLTVSIFHASKLLLGKIKFLPSRINTCHWNSSRTLGMKSVSSTQTLI